MLPSRGAACCAQGPTALQTRNALQNAPNPRRLRGLGEAADFEV
jgi:hypothetical protein